MNISFIVMNLGFNYLYSSSAMGYDQTFWLVLNFQRNSEYLFLHTYRRISCLRIAWQSGKSIFIVVHGSWTSWKPLDLPPSSDGLAHITFAIAYTRGRLSPNVLFTSFMSHVGLAIINAENPQFFFFFLYFTIPCLFYDKYSLDSNRFIHTADLFFRV